MTKIKKKIHVRKGDTVKIISGNDKGKVGEIIKIITKTGKVIIKNINMKTKHLRPKEENKTGQIIQIERPIDSSNVMLYSKNHKIASRYHHIINENNIKEKILNKTGEIIKKNNYE